MCLLEQTTLSLEEGAISGIVSLVPLRARGGILWYARVNDVTYTERFLSSLIALISIFRRPMATAGYGASESPSHALYRDAQKKVATLQCLFR